MALSEVGTVGKAVPNEAGPTATWLSRFGPPVLSLIVFLVIWQLIVTITGLKPFIFPGPLDVLQRGFIENAQQLIAGAWFTFRSSAVAFIAVIVLGTAISFLLASSRLIEKAVYPYMVMLQSTPVIAIAPIIIIWFGLGFGSIVVISIIIAIFAVVANTTQGLISVENNMQNLFKLYGANSAQTLWKLRLPFALPYMVTGWRIASAQVVIGAIVGEYMAGAGGGGLAGLGIIIAESSVRLRTPYLFSAALTAAFLGIAFFLLVNFIGHLLLRSWHESAVQHEN